MLESPVRWRDLAFPRCPGLKNCVVLWGTHSICVPCQGPLVCLLVLLCLCVLDGCSEAVMRFEFGPWVCPCSGLYDGNGGGCLGGGGGSPTAPFHPTADPHSTCSSQHSLPRHWPGVIYSCFIEEEMEAQGGCPACVGHTGV